MWGRNGRSTMSGMRTRDGFDRRSFLKTAGVSLAAGLTPSAAEAATAQVFSEKNKLDRIATNSYALRQLFRTRSRSGGGRGSAAGGRGGAGGGRGGGSASGGEGETRLTTAQMKQKYGEITMIDFPKFTKDTFPGVTRLDIRSGCFGDAADDSMYVDGTFDPSSASGKRWLERFANKLVTTGTRVHHISNNAPTNLAESDVALRKAGVEVAKKWLD